MLFIELNDSKKLKFFKNDICLSTGMLTMIQEEVHDAPLYFIQDKMCGVVGTRPVKLTVFMSALLNAGYRWGYIGNRVWGKAGYV